MKRGFHGATPIVEGVVEVVDIMRARRRRRALALEAMVAVSFNKLKIIGI